MCPSQRLRAAVERSLAAGEEEAAGGEREGGFPLPFGGGNPFHAAAGPEREGEGDGEGALPLGQRPSVVPPPPEMVEEYPWLENFLGER